MPAEKFASVSDVDSGVVDKLNAILESIDVDSSSKNYQVLFDFLQKGFGNQAVQVWSFYAQVNNLRDFGNSANVLGKLLKVLDNNSTFHDFGNALITLILTSYIKVLYRGLVNPTIRVTKPTLDLMKEMISFASFVNLESFISYFDFSLPGLARLLMPSKNDISSDFDPENSSNRLKLRQSFLDFWILLISNCPALLRKDLITDNTRFMSVWLKYMDKADNMDIIIKTLDLFEQKILNEPIFKRTTKTKILNEFALGKIHSYYNSSNKDLVKKTNDFFLTYVCDPEANVTFPDNTVWFNESPTNSGSEGVPVTINQKEFNIHNKLLFNVLRSFKPWEDDLQSTTVIKILDFVPELIPPYCNLLATQGSHDPKMSSYWFGMTLLLGRIINLKIPDFMEKIETNMVPKASLVMENILPTLITKSALTNSLQHESMLIKQLASQLIIFAFQKLEKVLDLYDRKGWQISKVIISNAFYSNMPDLSIVTSALNQVYTTAKNNKILSLSLTEILKHYSKRFPNFFNINLPVSNIYSDIMKSNTFEGIDLAILEGFLQYQEYNDSQIKWWNSSNESNSLFTSLLKLASSKNFSSSVSQKIVRLLDRLLYSTIIFIKHPCSAIYPLVNSLQVLSQFEDENELQKLWKMLDNTISRCVKTPYKYSDMSQSYDCISPFVVVLLEQWNFVEEKENSLLLQKWICIFLQYIVSIGESELGIKNACQTIAKGIKEEYIDLYLQFNNYEKHSQKLRENEYLLSDKMDSSFYEYILLTPLNSLNKIVRFPVNDFDVTGIFFRLKMIVMDQDTNVNKSFKNIVEGMVAKIYSFIGTTDNSNLINSSIIMPLFDQLKNNNISKLSKFKVTYILLTIINSAIYDVIDSSFEGKVSDLLNIISEHVDESDQCKRPLQSKMISFMDAESVLKLTKLGFDFSIESALVSLNKIIKSDSILDGNTFLDFMKFKDAEIVSKLIVFLEESRIDKLEDDKFLTIVIQDSIYSPILECYMKSSYFDAKLLLSKLDLLEKNEKLAIAVACNAYATGNESLDSFKASKLIEIKERFGSETFSSTEEALQLFCLSSETLSEDEISNIQKYLVTKYSHKYKPSVIRFMRLVDRWDSEAVKIWLNKLVLYVTKSISEKNQLSDQFKDTLLEYQGLLKSISIWNMVNASFLNSQLEAIINSSLFNETPILETVLLILCGSGSDAVESSKFMQQILNSDSFKINHVGKNEYNSFLIISAIYSLFKLDEKSNCNRFVQEKLLELYNGTIDVKDGMILNMLEVLEANLSISWTNYIYTWEFLDDLDEEAMDLIGEVKLITKQKEGFVVTLKKESVQQTIKNYCMDRPSLPEFNKTDGVKNWDSFISSHESSLRLYEKQRIYNPMFLLLLIIQNEELVHQVTVEETTTYKFEVKKLISSNLLQFVICALGDKNEEISKIALSLISGMMNSLDDSPQFKEGVIYKILFKRIMYTFEAHKKNVNEKIKLPAPAIWFVVSYISEVLVMPLSPLHEKCYKWVLNGHYIRHTEIPLLQELMDPTTKTSDRTIDYEHYYKHLSWMLEIIEIAINTEDDVNLIKGKGVFEWLMNTMSSPYLNNRLKSMMNSILFKVQRITNGGSTLLTRYATLSTLEINDLNLTMNLQDTTKLLEQNPKNKNLLKKSLAIKETKLNTEQVLQSFATIINAQKRLSTWVADDNQNLTKRICK